MATRNRIKFSERQAALIWQQVVGKELAGTEDELVNVIYPGRISGDDGPDFRDAVIAHKSRLTKGDVEVHVKSSDWYSHAHHADAAYNNVILHVVLWHDSSSATLVKSGKLVPVLCLAQVLRHQPYLLPQHLPCFQILDHMDSQTLAKLLTATGQERFTEKARQFQDEVLRFAQKEEAEQVLFRGLMRALGYAKNTKPFQELADRMPLSSLEARKGLAAKQALLLGAAGLLPSQRKQGKSSTGLVLSPSKEQEVQELEQIWRSEGQGIEAMTEDAWNFSHIYPNNSPVRRLIAQSYLLERYRKEGLLAGILRLVREAPLPAGHRVLNDSLTVVGDGYWRDHFDFDARNKTKIPALLGRSKAGEIAVNVVLPFAFSWGELADEPKLRENAMELYSNYPKLAENYLTRHMRNQLDLEGHFALTACHQQGLIHIFRSYCREGRCAQCPLASSGSSC
ncbi:MAG: DUF2851 family protein [Chloroflexi bacterium]|nr:DUF2851 family protein [Chloroflexota bacterium]NWF78210.1 DUF2851 family protein [Chloroflexota bacterium]